MSAPEARALCDEHVLLGASFEDDRDGACPRVISYLGEKDLDELGGDAFLCDLSGSCYLLAAGALAGGLATAAFAGRIPAVGECAFGACLSGDGAVVGVPLLLRTGTDELVVLDASPRAGALEGWLSFLRSVEAGGVRPYEGVSLEDAHGTLVPLLLSGAAAERVLLDYVPAGTDLPRAGQLAQLRLDRIAGLVARVPVVDAPSYLVFVPAPMARVLWRSLLSFTEVAPVGHGALRRALSRGLPWGELLRSTDRVCVGRPELEGWGLVRNGNDFVGARALAAQEASLPCGEEAPDGRTDGIRL